jgi:hypothetical protein
MPLENIFFPLLIGSATDIKNVLRDALFCHNCFFFGGHYESFMLVGLFKTAGNATEGCLVIG